MWNKTGWNHYCYNSHELYLCGGSIYSLYVAVTAVLLPSTYWFWVSVALLRYPQSTLFPSLRATKFDTHTVHKKQLHFTRIYTGHIVKLSLFNFIHLQNTKPEQSIILVTASKAWRRHSLYRSNPVARRVFVFNHYPFSSFYLLLYPTISFTLSFKSKEKDLLRLIIFLPFRMGRGGGEL